MTGCAILSAAALLAGCIDVKVPVYKRPDTPEKTAFTTMDAVKADPTETIRPDWWKQFQDPYLDGLIEKAINGNFDIKVLAARIQVAGAQIGEARAGALPSMDVGAGASFEKTTGQTFTKQYNLGTQVNWDIDIWGAVEKGVQAQKAEYRASEADWRAGYLELVANVSTTYFQILQFDDQIQQQTLTIATNEKILTIFEGMEKNGLVPHTQVLTQRAELNRLTRDLLELRRARDLADNALATLTGVPAGEFKLPDGQLQKRVQVPPVPSGLPSHLLARRPDLIAAEYRVLESYDLVGQAKLAQLPTISLTGRGGTASFALTDLMKSFTFGFMPSINIPILDPSVRAHVKTTEAQSTVAEQQYRSTVMNAFEEVENALVNLNSHTRQRDELQQEVAHLTIVAAQIDAQLKEGVISQLEVFETERTLLAAQLALLANHQQILSDTVTLYKALGGGWPAVDVQRAAVEKKY
ncbi:efflux transporter outer membrane subunit [Caballeronia sp. LZ062]|uniref:efflux transporter outer membrane subunit n=1 Tax=unclassified Caballeronia TaxID=2646786 RepID=UPI00286659A3|nr:MULTISPECIES: efflux transporter outer membrane subunit [unclassified Caballeronia]MDR5857456.1 efflux transporter outer membrane subunit [Caballeronia sp. LZ050]MDR5869007.1 efflux transporter outer membrane subunit [Caballeronia sp. LZ062]